MSTRGFIHSTESFGTVDGPGIRYVVFMQGCPLRCAYCHNPDTWEIGTGHEMTSDEILREYKKNEDFYARGGITVTGGEPLLQMDFVIDLFKKAKESGIHTCLDTSGITYNEKSEEQLQKFDELVEYSDLVMLDIKHIDTNKHKALTGMGNENVLLFAKYLERKNIPVWIRHIIIEGITDDEAALRALGRFVGGLTNLKALDVLPYHTLGVSKYAQLGIPYPLEGLSALSMDDAIKAKKYILDEIQKIRR